MSDKRNYCEDCEWAKSMLFSKEYPKCSHPAHRQGKAFTHRQNDVERYPFCSHINTSGRCVYYAKKENVFTNLKVIWNNLWGKGL